MAPAGWNTREQIDDHKLAASIINGHGTENDAVFDDRGLDLLQRFCADPSIANRDRLLEEHEWVDEAGGKPGDKAAGKGDLAGFLVARHGTHDPALDERDLDMLKAWFEKGRPMGQNVSR
ncbi:hypothetical protein M409DRAFT_49236 [Zasmidium cellare ATCC 36951]|uniref:Uncharacterized protein n=1 Tax=Zasmidium cellare ATCC 36951 TaxID=1080233 RepID=A0A6A6CZW7_ZASCE|nr:uncharacterized protein M409DRAFT_49236 [Zasmidium cellare ATCC 36951]KAF2172694.1 hypothetical protein M409DRAFT_49236 [Zasmidium cellare ATCC 36951]